MATIIFVLLMIVQFIVIGIILYLNFCPTRNSILFTDWYKETYKQEWHIDYALLYGMDLIYEYEEFCKQKNIRPVWNG